MVRGTQKGCFKTASAFYTGVGRGGWWQEAEHPSGTVPNRPGTGTGPRPGGLGTPALKYPNLLYQVRNAGAKQVGQITLKEIIGKGNE